MKKSLFILSLAAALVCAGCGSKKQVTVPTGEEEVVVPCKEFKSDKKTFRATGNAISANMQQATHQAALNARAELATSLNVVIKRVSDNYTSNYELNNATEFRGKFEDMTRQVVKEMVSGSPIVCDRMTKKTNKDGSIIYHGYVAVEVVSNDVVQEIKTRVDNQEKLRTDFEFEKFKKEFEKEMEHFGE